MTDLVTPRAATVPPGTGTDWSADLVTRCDYAFHVRPAAPSDEAALATFFTHVDKADLRFRFLTAIQKVSHDQLQALVAVDHDRTENFLAIDPDTGSIVATAMLATDTTLTNAEVAVAIRSDFKRGGISWTLLDHVARFAMARGITTLESIESRDNHEAIALERERGWTATACPGDPTLMILRKTLAPTAPTPARAAAHA